MDYDEKTVRIVTVDIDTKRSSVLADSKLALKKMEVCGVRVHETKRGYHLVGIKYASYWEVLVIRLLAGDDLKRLRLDAWPNKHAKNVLFTKKWKVNKK